jgi:Fe-S cluster biosynthesis and repair protein YggX
MSCCGGGSQFGGPPQEAQNASGHKVFCVKFQREMPGLDEPPFDSPLGQRIYDNVSAEAWKLWGDYCKMVLNEYRLNPANRSDQEVILKYMEDYFFGEQSAFPPGYVPPKAKG